MDLQTDKLNTAPILSPVKDLSEITWLTPSHIAAIGRVLDAINTPGSTPFPFTAEALDMRDPPDCGAIKVREADIDGEIGIIITSGLTVSIVDAKGKRKDALYQLIDGLRCEESPFLWSADILAWRSRIISPEIAKRAGRKGGRSKWAGSTPEQRAATMKAVRDARWANIESISRDVAASVGIAAVGDAIEEYLDFLDIHDARRRVIRNRVIATIIAPKPKE